MICSNCGRQLADDAVFCPFCGHKVEVVKGLPLTENAQETPTPVNPPQETPSQETPQETNPSQDTPPPYNPPQGAPQEANPSQDTPPTYNPPQGVPHEANPSQDTPPQYNPPQGAPQEANSSQDTPPQPKPTQGTATQGTPIQGNPIQGNPKQPNSSWLDQLNRYVGNEQATDLNWKMLFTDVTKKHTTEEAEDIFIYGTRRTTPPLNEVSKDWPHPWLYSRVFIMFFIAFILLWLCINMFHNVLAIPGLFMVGSFMVPLTTLVLFIEVNAWRNISFFEVIKIFFVGGCASLVATLFLFSIFDVKELNFIGAVTTGCVEEVGKLAIIYLFMKRLNKMTILNAMLIGAAVGAGFAAFESAGYAMFFSGGNIGKMIDIIFIRGILTPGGHVTWAAITGAALAIASKAQNGTLSTSVLTSSEFLRLFCIPVILHAVWDSPINNLSPHFPLIQIALTVFVWIIVLILINMGLNEVSKAQSTVVNNNINNK